jgi:hypothetical protein
MAGAVDTERVARRVNGAVAADLQAIRNRRSARSGIGARVVEVTRWDDGELVLVDLAIGPRRWPESAVVVLDADMPPFVMLDPKLADRLERDHRLMARVCARAIRAALS